MKTCVFAGTFDPFTVGHKAAIDKILRSFRRVLIVVGENPDKVPFFSQSERAEMIRAAYKGNSRVRVAEYSAFNGGYAEFLNSLNITEYYRGIRNFADYQFEKAKESKNSQLYPNIKTFYVFPYKYRWVSSSVVRERISKGLDVKRLIPKKAYSKFKKILADKQQG